MDLRNKIDGKRNTTVKVNGTEYAIDATGIARNVADADAKKLLQNMQAWVTHSEPTDSTVITRPIRKPTLAPETKTESPKLNFKMAPILEKATIPVMPPTTKFNIVDVAVAPVEQEEPATPIEPAKATPWEIPVDGADWPDPTVDMPLAYLQKMGEAYEVKYIPKKGKAPFIEAIRKAMYPDDE